MIWKLAGHIEVVHDDIALHVVLVDVFPNDLIAGQSRSGRANHVGAQVKNVDDRPKLLLVVKQTPRTRDDQLGVVSLAKHANQTAAFRVEMVKDLVDQCIRSEERRVGKECAA